MVIASVVVFLASSVAAQQHPGNFCANSYWSGSLEATAAPELTGKMNTGPALGGVTTSQKNAGNFSRLSSVFLADTAHYQFIDTNYVNFKWWPSFVGGDLFMDLGVYGLNLSKPGQVAVEEGFGAEIRVRPIFFGGMVGFSGDPGIRYVSYPRNFFLFYSIYVGVITDQYRFEVGETYGYSDWATHSLGMNYTSGYLGIGKRWSNIVFFEPEFRINFPIVSHYSLEPSYSQFIPMTGHYGLRDLYFSINAKFGIGFN